MTQDDIKKSHRAFRGRLEAIVAAENKTHADNLSIYVDVVIKFKQKLDLGRVEVCSMQV